ncbi:MAG: methyltransferase [Polyangiaceae bacterium]
MSDDIEYPSSAIAYTHPARLSATAIQRGLVVEFRSTFSYLELACGDASNLLPLAVQFPEATFIGVDLDAGAILRGERRANALGVKNLRLIAGNLSDVALSGAFDFVIAHGVYSWVAADVQAALLRRAREWLAERGVLYVSYNTLPGWGLRGVLRAVMRDAAAEELEPRAKLRKAKLAVSRLQQHVPQDNPYGALLGAELGLVLNKQDGYLLGEHLAEHNEALFVGEFLGRAGEQGLQFLGEQIAATPDGALEQRLPAQLEALGLPEAEAQRHLDVLCYRQFRATLLCHQERALKPRLVARLRDAGFIAGHLNVLAQEPLLAPGEKLGFETAQGVVIESEQPLQKAALLVLSRSFPRGLRIADLMSAALAELKARALLEVSPVSPSSIEDAIRDLLDLVERRQLELLPWTPQTATRIVGPRPCLPALTRLEATRGHVTTPRHEALTLDGFRAAVLTLLDGRHDVGQLVGELRALLEAGELRLSAEERKVFEDDASVQALILQCMREALQFGLFTPETTTQPAPQELHS